jgi:hypothetical protein
MPVHVLASTARPVQRILAIEPSTGLPAARHILSQRKTLQQKELACLLRLLGTAFDLAQVQQKEKPHYSHKTQCLSSAPKSLFVASPWTDVQG